MQLLIDMLQRTQFTVFGTARVFVDGATCDPALFELLANDEGGETVIDYAGHSWQIDWYNKGGDVPGEGTVCPATGHVFDGNELGLEVCLRSVHIGRSSSH